MLSDINQAKELLNKPKITDTARELDIDNDINVFTKNNFEYSVQPTDDGKELYVESENTIWVSLLYDITESALLKPILEVQKAEQARKNSLERQNIENIKQESEATKLEAEKLSVLQEKQEADRLKQELLDKQAAIASKQNSTTDSAPVANTSWTTDWGNDIKALVTTEKCTDGEFLQQGYNYKVFSSIPLSRLKSPTDSWFISDDRATTVIGCWFKKQDGLLHLKMRRKKDNKIFEQDANINDGSWKEIRLP